MADRTYKVLAFTGENETVNEHFDPADVLVDLGIYTGHDAKAAIEAALGEKGLPEGAKVCVGIPMSNWNLHDVAPDPRPQFKVTPVKDAEPESNE